MVMNPRITRLIWFSVLLTIFLVAEGYKAALEFGSGKALSQYNLIEDPNTINTNYDNQNVFIKGARLYHGPIWDNEIDFYFQGYHVYRDVQYCRRERHRGKDGESDYFTYTWSSCNSNRCPVKSRNFYSQSTMVGAYKIGPDCPHDNAKIPNLTLDDISYIEKRLSSFSRIFRYSSGATFIGGIGTSSLCTSFTHQNIKVQYEIYNPMEASIFAIQSDDSLTCPHANYTGIVSGNVDAVNVLAYFAKSTFSTIAKAVIIIILFFIADSPLLLYQAACIVLISKSTIWKGTIFPLMPSVSLGVCAFLGISYYQNDIDSIGGLVLTSVGSLITRNCIERHLK